MEQLVQIERVEGIWGVVFYPFVGCNIEQAMILSKHTEMQWAERYKTQFIATMADYEGNK